MLASFLQIHLEAQPYLHDRLIFIARLQAGYSFEIIIIKRLDVVVALVHLHSNKTISFQPSTAWLKTKSEQCNGILITFEEQQQVHGVS